MAKQATHKFSGAHIALTTSLAPEHLAHIAKSVGESTKGSPPWHTVRFEGAQGGTLNFSVRTLKDVVEFMTFSVTIASDGRHSTLRSGIGSFKTSQQKYLMIPVSPKSMLSYRTYRSFMQNLQSAVLAADPATAATITERVSA